ncbi:MAG: flagellar hook capping FlgD N-terminal domain-containing protein [Thermoleophilaceae bacterium]|jgi:flagellar basal-body rod modification protein FlgD
MQTNPLQTMSPQGATASSGTTNKNAILGKDDFLKILVGEMSNMDPMSQNSQDPTQSVAQMAQFSIVEQLTNLKQTTEKSSAMSMLGKTVTYKTASDGTVAQGVVKGVDTSGGDPTLTVDTKAGVTLDSITGVQ